MLLRSSTMVGRSRNLSQGTMNHPVHRSYEPPQVNRFFHEVGEAGAERCLADSTCRAASPRSGASQRERAEVGSPSRHRTALALGCRQDSLWVDLVLESGEGGSPSWRGTRGPIGGRRPRRVCRHRGA